MIYEEHLNFHNLSYMIARAKPGLTIHLLYASVCVCVCLCATQTCQSNKNQFLTAMKHVGGKGLRCLPILVKVKSTKTWTR